MKTRFPRMVLASALLGGGLMVGGCPIDPGDPNSTQSTAKSATKLTRFASEAELLSFFRERVTATNQQRSTQFFGGGVAISALPESAPQADASAAGSGGEFTTTNVQEAGVDESDVIKSDGKHLFIARGTKLTIVNAVPHDAMQVVGAVTFEQYVHEMYLYGDSVLVLAQGGAVAPAIDIGGVWAFQSYPPYYLSNELHVYQVNVADPANPVIVHRAVVDGSIASSRVVGDRLILVLTIAPNLPANPTPLALAALSLDDIEPKIVTASGDASQSSERGLAPWNEWYRPDVPDGYYMTAVVTLDAGNVETVKHSTAILAGAGTIYASTEALYLTDVAYDEADNYRESTVIHKLSLLEDGTAQYAATGVVPGRLLNQFSLGEFEGVLRVATHVSPTFSPVAIGIEPAAVSTSPAAQASNPEPNTNSVYTLVQDGAALKIAGRVEGLAPNETIYSARFIGPRGFLVTFRQVDPLFVLDLSDPSDPRVTGELKIPGYSDYLHPLGASHLIGVGRTVATAEWGGVIRDAIQLSLFDVSDLSDPKLVQQLSLGNSGSYSDVSYTHRAFTFLESGGLLALPAQLATAKSNISPQFVYQPPEDAVLCLHVDATAGFTTLGKLTFPVPGDFSYIPWRRAAIIGDVIYGITSDSIVAAPKGALTNVKTLVLP